MALGRAGGKGWMGRAHRPQRRRDPVIPRFFVPPGSIERTAPGPLGAQGGFTAANSGGEAPHAVHELRLGAGVPIVLLDGRGEEYWGTIERITHGRDGPRIEVKGATIRRSEAEPPFQIYLVQGLPKGDKLDAIVEKGTEVGVTHFLPVRTER